MVTVTIVAGAVPLRGSGSPDYSRTVLGSQQLPVQQTSGAVAVTSISGDTVYTQSVTELFAPADNVINVRQLQSSGGRVRVEVFPHVAGVSVGGGTPGAMSWDRMRSVSGAHISGWAGLLAVGFVSGANVVAIGRPVTSGDPVRRVEHGYVLSGGDVVVSSPASGKALLVRDLHDSYMGTSGIVPVAYRLGQGAGPVYDHQVGAGIPNWDKDLIGEEMLGPRRTASGVADLVINVGVPSTSGVSYTAIVEEV